MLDPAPGIDGAHDVVVRDGGIAELAAPGAADAEGAEVVDAEGLHAFPAFFDPHVHLRTPGHEHKEDIETGTRAAAAGGFCGDPRDGQHRAAGLDRRPTSRRCASARRARAPRSRSASWPP